MALAWCLTGFVESRKDGVSRDELAAAFLDIYTERLKNGMPQLSDPGSETVMEGIVRSYLGHGLDRAEALRQIKAKAFHDVIRSFHLVDGAEVPVKFYLTSDDGLTLTKDLRRVIIREGSAHILAEIDQKWTELELAWKENRDRYLRDKDSRVSVWVADVGSIAMSRFGWCQAIPGRGPIRTGGDISEFADGIVEDLSGGRKVALGFECPLFIPIPEEPVRLGKARFGEGDRPWSAHAGAASLTVGLSQSAWILRRIALTARSPVVPTFGWRDTYEGQSNLFIWEAFVSGKTKADSHTGDAEMAAKAFLDAYPHVEQASSVTCESPLSVVSAALRWAGFAPPDHDVPCVVIKAGR